MRNYPNKEACIAFIITLMATICIINATTLYNQQSQKKNLILKIGQLHAQKDLLMDQLPLFGFENFLHLNEYSCNVAQLSQKTQGHICDITQLYAFIEENLSHPFQLIKNQTSPNEYLLEFSGYTHSLRDFLNTFFTQNTIIHITDIEIHPVPELTSTPSNTLLKASISNFKINIILS